MRKIKEAGAHPDSGYAPAHSNERPWLASADGVTLAVRLTPKGGRDTIDGIERLADGRAVLKARVRAAASEGEANAALIKLVAKALGVAPRDITLVTGATARLKRLKINGAGAALAAALEKICAIG
jgi:uncharacterized protein (TIGR00251 family)